MKTIYMVEDWLADDEDYGAYPTPELAYLKGKEILSEALVEMVSNITVYEDDTVDSVIDNYNNMTGELKSSYEKFISGKQSYFGVEDYFWVRKVEMYETINDLM